MATDQIVICGQGGVQASAPALVTSWRRGSSRTGLRAGSRRRCHQRCIRGARHPHRMASAENRQTCSADASPPNDELQACIEVLREAADRSCDVVSVACIEQLLEEHRRDRGGPRVFGDSAYSDVDTRKENNIQCTVTSPHGPSRSFESEEVAGAIVVASSAARGESADGHASENYYSTRRSSYWPINDQNISKFTSKTN